MSKQSMEALERANEVRLAHAQIKKWVNSGGISVYQGLIHPIAKGMTVYAVVKAQKGWGRYKTLTLLNSLSISESKRVEVLTTNQVIKIAEGCEK